MFALFLGTALASVPTAPSYAMLPTGETSAVDLDAVTLDDADLAVRWRRGPPPPPYRRYPPPPRVVVRGGPPPAPAPAPPPPELHDVSLSLSALHLALPMAAVDAELRLASKGGLALTGGLGSLDGTTLFDLGAQIRGDVIGNFDRGVYLGVGGRYTDVPFYAVSGPAGALDAVIGFKYTFDTPLTLDAQVGPQVVNSAAFRALGPMVKLNVGWSF